MITGCIGPPTVTQEDLLSFLQDPGSYPHRPRGVHLKQTHSAYVAIASPFVYKVRKPVDFGFLDFSTLEKRRHFSHREIELNGRLCPDLYLGVTPISLSGDRLVLGAGEGVVDCAVTMRELEARWFMKSMLHNGEVAIPQLNRIVERLQSFYRGQSPGPNILEWGRMDRVRVSTDENFRQTQPFIGQTISRGAFEAIEEHTRRFYEWHAGLFDERVRRGRIVEGHGDLHLEHIHLAPRQVTIFDCIEFNERFRFLDVANDVAFLAMDLDFEGRPDLARRFVSGMAEALDDPDIFRLIDFYKCYRAFVRGKVESLQSGESEVSSTDRKSCADLARRYFRLALRYAVAGSTPTALAVMGRPGSGKSALATALAEELDCAIFSSDRVRKQLAGLPLTQRSDAKVRAQLYSPAMSAQTYDALMESALQQTRTGRCVVIDATFSKQSIREEWRRRLREAGVELRFVEASAPVAILRERLTARYGEADVISDARAEDFEKLAKAYEPPDELPEGELTKVATTATRDASLTQCLVNLAGLQAARSGTG